MPKRKPIHQRDDGLLPRNISFLGRGSRPRRKYGKRGAGGRRRRSWVRRIVTAYVRSAAILMLLSLLPTLAIAALLWWFTPAWLIAPGGWLPEWPDAVSLDHLVDWSQQATDGLRNFVEPPARQETHNLQPVSVAPPTFDTLPTDTLLNSTTPTE